MIPQIGQHVKCVLRTGAIAEGIVKEWSENSIQLQCLDGESILIIPHPADDIMLIKVLINKAKKIDKPILENKIELDLELKDAVALPSDDLRIKKIAELKILLAAQEKKIVADKLKSHEIGQIKKVEYEHPGFYKKQSIK